MTCITVVRLGQISNNKRPQNELTAALKGRIAYLPVDVNANATFLPDNLLNVDSLVLLVGGQPTKQKKVGTSAVDLCKVHATLSWLRQNNCYYKDVPAYTVSDIEKIIADKLQPTADNDTCLMKKLDDASKSHMKTFQYSHLVQIFQQTRWLTTSLTKKRDYLTQGPVLGFRGNSRFRIRSRPAISPAKFVIAISHTFPMADWVDHTYSNIHNAIFEGQSSKCHTDSPCRHGRDMLSESHITLPKTN